MTYAERKLLILCAQALLRLLRMGSGLDAATRYREIADAIQVVVEATLK
jgi:hypothetical protein